MLQFIAEKSTSLLCDKIEIKAEERAIYRYGFELFWSTFFSVSSMIILALIFDYVAQVLIFISFFMPIRMAAGGVHASSYKNCWCLTNMIALGCVIAGWWLSEKFMPGVISLALLIVTMQYIWRTAPVQLIGDQQKEETVRRNRRYSHIILVGEAVVFLVLLCIGDSRLYYTAAVTSYIVAVMIWIAIRGERRKEHE